MGIAVGFVLKLCSAFPKSLSHNIFFSSPINKTALAKVAALSGGGVRRGGGRSAEDGGGRVRGRQRKVVVE